eukprot:2557618-Pleurochrysis_carterae.AAC.1
MAPGGVRWRAQGMKGTAQGAGCREKARGAGPWSEVRMALGAGRREVVCSDGIGAYKLIRCAAVVVAVFINHLFASRAGRRRHIP